MTDRALTAPATIRYCARCGSGMETREVAGKARRACPACRYVHFVEPKVAVGIVVIERRRLLLVQRAKPPEAGKWSVPAGFLDYGEDPRETAVREALEETSLHVAITGLVDVFHNPPLGAGASVFILYRAKRVSGTLGAGDDAAAAGFFAPGDLPPLAFASTLAAVEELRRLERPG